MKSDRDALASSHRLLLAILRHAEGNAIHCGNRQACHADACPERKACIHKTREAFHRVLFATIGHFSREDKLIRQVITPESFARHAEGHAAITDAIQQAINDFSRDKDVPAAFRSIFAIGQLYAAHHTEQDSEYLDILAVRTVTS